MDRFGSPSQSPAPRQQYASSPTPIEPDARNGDPPHLGRYLVTGRIGRGGMGVVYEARDTLLDRMVAIKLLPPAVSESPEALTRFLREAQGAASLSHPNVVGVYDIGESDGTRYIVMELVRGANAQEILKANGPFSWSEATRILLDICRGVAAAHAAGFIHRDIKPANILRSTDGGVKLADFGLVKPTGVGGAAITTTGETVGTPHFMSPEQIRCAPLDERSDIYALGATYFALLTGRPPYQAADPMQVLFAHCSRPVPDPRQLVPQIPEACAAVVRRAMAKDRAKRYARAGELAADLEKVLALGSSDTGFTGSERPGAWSAGTATENTGPLSIANAYPGEQTAVVTERKRPGWLIAGAGTIAVLVTVILAVSLPNLRDRPTTVAGNADLRVEQDDWPEHLAAADKAVNGRDPRALRAASDRIKILQRRLPADSVQRHEEIRGTLARLEKALAFRESITGKGLVIGLDQQVTCVAFSPDDRWVAAGQFFGRPGAVIFDSHTGEKHASVLPAKGNSPVKVMSLAFAHDSSVLAAACAGDTDVRLWHFATRSESTLAAGPDLKGTLSVAFSPNRRTLVASIEPVGEGKGKPYLKVWDLDGQSAPFQFKAEHSARVPTVAFCAGGEQIASGSRDKRVVMWNAETGRIWRELGTGLDIHAIACSPHGRTLAVAGSDEQQSALQFWDYAGERLLESIPSPHGRCTCVTYSRDGTVLASGSGSRILLWNPDTRELLATLEGHGLEVTALAFSGDGVILASGSLDQTMRLWDVTRRPHRAQNGSEP